MDRPTRRRSTANKAKRTRQQRHKQEDQLETLDNKRARLRHELRQAHSAWLLESDSFAQPAPANASDGATDSHSSDSRTRWANYLAAKQRLVAAYAEEAPAT